MRHNRSTLRRLVVALLWTFGAMVASLASAAEMGDVPWDEWDAQARAAREIVNIGEIRQERLEELRATFEMQRSEASRVSAAAADEISRIEGELQALGDPPAEGETEAPAAARIRSELNEALSSVRAVQGRADRAVTRARDLIADLAELGQQRFIQRLGELKPSPALPTRWVTAGAFLGQIFDSIRGEVREMADTSSMGNLLQSRLPLAALAIASALFVAFGVRTLLLRLLLKRADESSPRRNRLLIGVGATLTRILALLIAAILFFVGIDLLDVFGKVGEAFFTGFGLGLFLLVGAYSIAAALFSPMAAGLRASNVNDSDARMGFIATLVLGVVLHLTAVVDQVGEVLTIPDGASAVYTVVFIAIGACALWVLSNVMQFTTANDDPQEDGQIGVQVNTIIRRILKFVAIVSPILALIGYEFAARYLFFPTVISLGVIGVAHLVFVVIREGVEIYLADSGEGTSETTGQRLRLIPILIAFLLFCALVPLLALIWGATVTDLLVTYEAISEGFRIGDVALSPMDFVTFALVFVIGYTLTRMLQRVLRLSVLPKAGMNRGGADAIGAGVGYVGVFLSAIAAISAAGLDLSNLAIVAGALSVGIGFGLQNIVNNFVSGVILLVERPIRVGDWIEVGGFAGYVKKVNVRSTEIETFDRATYILPNSDLISGAVLNWTHADTTGRVIAPVGVAYGTDPRLVERVLLDIARDHPMVIASPAPVAYLMQFGSDSVDFELRVFLRDVNWMLSVRSDLNFKIAERFAEEGIEIPFAQRDLHIKNPEALADAFRGPRNSTVPDERTGPSAAADGNGP
ncbi:MAG: DUF3772 domain-containing protein [Pseudomonadota bacterium]